MNHAFAKIIRSKFAADSLVNIASIFFLGACGLLLNFIIARQYNAQTLGIFNEVYAFYIIFSQFATLGVQVSSLKHTAQYASDPEECKALVTSAFILVALSAAFFSVLLFLLRTRIAGFFGSQGVATGILWVIPGLWCFSLNKLLLNILNGFRSMKAYAAFTSFRYVAMLSALATAVWLGVAGDKLSVLFSVAESLLFLVLVFYQRRYLSAEAIVRIRPWIRRHLSFGLRSMIGGVTADLNTRIDVIILGYFTSDRMVGIYSFAATMIEGMAQIPYILKQNIDPLLTNMALEKRFADIQTMVKKGRTFAFAGMLVMGVAAAALYNPVVSLVTANQDFQQSWSAFCILIAGLIIQSGYMPFSGILVQSGFPFLQTVHQLSFTFTNIALNIVLAPLFGVTGAAVATSLAFVMFVLYLKYFTYRALRIAI